VNGLIGNVEKRSIELAHYIIETKSTVRHTAEVFGISKSTVHNDVTKRLARINPLLYSEVKEVLEENKAQRHIRGGLATKEKYSKIKNS
jgi:putative DeoR family transcriptional regulator (stage III sporulation protein D)